MKIYSTGATPSPVDYRTIKHDTSSTKSSPIPPRGGVIYEKKDIDDQHAVGICTGISKTQNSSKVAGKRYCPSFQYLLQKKYFDYNWTEGSSIFAALKMANKYGFLPIELSPFTEADRYLPYSEYVLKLRSISDQEIARLLTLCEKKLTGYAQVTDMSSDGLARAILSSKAGILCRYDVGNEWWTPPVNPLRPPKVIISGHAINMTYYDYTDSLNQVLANTWGSDWNRNGSADINYANNRPTEAWIPYYDIIPDRVVLPKREDFRPNFKNCEKGDNNQAVKDLQTALMILGYLELLKTSEFGVYGAKTQAAVYNFQLKYVPNLSYLAKYVYQGRYCAQQTISALNMLFVK